MNIETIKKQAKEYYSKGRFQSALNMLFRLKKQHPNDPEILNDIGTILYSMGKKEESLDFFLSAIQIDPNHKDTLDNLQKVAQDKSLSNDLKLEIQNLFGRSISRPKHCEQTNDILDLLYTAEDMYKNGNLQAAVDLCFKAIKIDPNFNEALHLGAILLHQLGDSQNAYQLARNSTGGKPVTGKPQFKYYQILADIAHSLGDIDEAVFQRSRAETLKKIYDYAKYSVNIVKQLENEQKAGNKADIDNIIDESRKTLSKPGWNIIGYHLLTHAITIKGEIKSSNQVKILDSALKSKDWLNKRPLYHYWFDKVCTKNKKPKPRVSIVVISYRLHPKTKYCLKKLQKQVEKWGEIIFVNNGAPDEDFESLMPYIDTYVKLKGNAGASLPRNLGAVFSNAPLLMFIEDDGIPTPGLVKAHMSVYEHYKAVTVRGVYRAAKPPFPAHYSLGNQLKPAMNNQEGNSSFLSKPFFHVGGWGDDLFFGSEGRELGFRLVKSGYGYDQHLYTPDAVLCHDFFRDEKHMNKRWLQTRASWILLHTMYPTEFAEYQYKWWKISKGLLPVTAKPIKKTAQ